MPLESEKKSDFLKNDESFATKTVHVGRDPDKCQYGNMAPSIVVSTTFKQNIPPESHKVTDQLVSPQDFKYARYRNPTRNSLQERLAALEEMKHCLVLPSGMAAVNLVLQIIEDEDHVVSQTDIFHGTYNLFKDNLAKRATIDFVDATNLNFVKKVVKSNTKLLWCETPTNPLMKVIDIKQLVVEVRKIAPSIIIVTDNTFMTPYFQRPGMFGVDIVLHSCTKYIGGHSDILMGALCLNNDDLHKQLEKYLVAQGPISSPFDCFLTLRSLSTLEVRMKKHMSNALAVAKFLEAHPKIEKVMHPGLQSHSQHKLHKSQTFGCSGMFSFYLKTDDLKSTAKFLDKLKVVTVVDSLGSVESTIKMPSRMPAASLSPEELKDQGITDGLLRLSIGIESQKDLIEDIRQALDEEKYNHSF